MEKQGKQEKAAFSDVAIVIPITHDVMFEYLV
jgi:hypothetical protein